VLTAEMLKSAEPAEFIYVPLIQARLACYFLTEMQQVAAGFLVNNP
jgi:hypothetical protein